MKAYWDEVDLRRMTFKPLKFENGDVDLIYRGLTTRAASAVVATNLTPGALHADDRSNSSASY